MKQVVSRAILPTKSERAERTAQELLHEIFDRGTPRQIEVITGTIGVYVEVLRARRKAGGSLQPGRGTITDIGCRKTGEGARPTDCRRSLQPGGQRHDTDCGGSR